MLIFSGSANAETSFGLAMHGKPKYGPEAKHLDYANPDAPKGGAVRIAGIGTFDTLNPFSIKGNAPKEGLNLAYDKLMVRVWDEPFTLYPLIAESADVPEDRSSITFHLNPKARFQDSSPITADDVLFSFETLKKDGRPNMRRVYALVKTAEKIDDHTVKLTLGDGYNRETVMILAMMPVLSKKWWQGRTFDAPLLEPPLLNGPYKIASVDPGRQIVYQRDPNYWAKDLFTSIGHYNPDKVVYDFYRNDMVAFEAFKSHNLDLRREYDGGKWSTGYDFPAVKDGRVTKNAIPHNRPEKTRGFIFNTRRAPFDDIHVRKALTLLLDFEWINQNLFHGQYKRIASYYPNSELAAQGMPDAKQLEVLNPWKGKIPDEAFGAAWVPPSSASPAARRKNMLEADALLKAARWIVKDGKRVKDSKPFAFEIILDGPEDEKIAINFKNTLAHMGIAANIRTMDNANYIGRMNEYDFDMTANYWSNSLSPGTEQLLYWGCQAAKEPARWNYPGICSPAIDALSQQIANAKDRETLVATTRALDRVLMAGAYMIPLYYAGADNVASWGPLKKHDKTALYGMVMETWWVDPARSSSPKGED